MFDGNRRKMDMNKIHTSFVLRIGAIVGMIIMMISGLAFAEDVPEGQECCACAQDEAAFDAMVAEACQNGYSDKGIENPTEEQMTECITQTKAQILENCREEGTRVATSDTDGDGVPDNQDNCPNIPNPLQVRTDPDVRFTGDFPEMCRFIDNADGTVTDYKNRLIWLKDAGSEEKMAKNEAEAYCEGLRIAGGGWRLPSEQNFQQFDLPSGHPFINVQAEAYWMIDTEWTGSARFRRSTDLACEVNGRCRTIDTLHSGGDDIYYVWPVRDMQ
jgi:hypothetical protein